MPTTLENLKAFNEAHPFLKEQREDVRASLNHLTSYYYMCQAAKVATSPDVDQAAGLLRKELDKLNEQCKQQAALQNANTEECLKAWREAQANA